MIRPFPRYHVDIETGILTPIEPPAVWPTVACLLSGVMAGAVAGWVIRGWLA